jgi:hypothetical protein
VSLAEPGDRPRHGAGRAADPEELHGALVEGDFDFHHRGGFPPIQPPSGNGDEEVEQPVAPIRSAMHEHEPARAGAGERALGHPRDEPRGHAGVDRVAALLEHLGAGLRGQRMAGGDGASHALPE